MARTAQVLSHWHRHFEDFRTSPLEFYKSVDDAIRRREIPDIAISRISYLEGGALSGSREYLRVVRGRHTFDICAAPFGKGFFFSTWCTATESRYGFVYAVLLMLALLFFLTAVISKLGFGLGLAMIILFGPLAFWALGSAIHAGTIGGEEIVLAMPFIGSIYERVFHPFTYFKHDTALMFQESVHAAVIEVIDSLRTEQGLRALSAEERLPKLKDLAA